MLTRRLKDGKNNEAQELPLVFLPIITKTRVPLLEGDFNFHKSNSTYFTDLDTSRSLLLSFLCYHGTAKTDKELGAEGRKGAITVMLGSTYTHFKREIPTGRAYEVWSRILTWDHKWLYVVTHFVRRGEIMPKACVADSPGSERKVPSLSASQVEAAVYATSISKCVFKKGRLTVSPERILHASGLMSNALPSGTSPVDLTHLNGKAGEEAATDVLEGKLSAQSDDDKVLSARIETERRKNLRFAELSSGLEDLHGNFLKDEEVLNGVITLGTFTDMGRRV
jgi:Thioesterase-like superfamily